MVAISKRESGNSTFLGFAEEDQEAVAEWRQARFEARQQRDSQSDISVSSIATDDISHLIDSEEEEEQEEEMWNVD